MRSTLEEIESNLSTQSNGRTTGSKKVLLPSDITYLPISTYPFLLPQIPRTWGFAPDTASLAAVWEGLLF